MRERLIELLEEAQEKAKGTVGSMNGGFGAWYADYLLENGVVVLPCKVGDECWCIRDFDKSTSKVTRCKVVQVNLDKKDIEYVVSAPYYAGMMPMFNIGVSKVFRTAEEALEALERGKR